MCSVRLVPCARGHSVQPPPNDFGLSFITRPVVMQTDFSLLDRCIRDAFFIHSRVCIFKMYFYASA